MWPGTSFGSAFNLQASPNTQSCFIFKGGVHLIMSAYTLVHVSPHVIRCQFAITAHNTQFLHKLKPFYSKEGTFRDTMSMLYVALLKGLHFFTFKTADDEFTCYTI